MPPNQSPFAALFNLFKGPSSNNPPSFPQQGGMNGYPRVYGYPGPGGGSGWFGPSPGNSGFGPPSSGPFGFGGFGNSGGGFNIGDIFKNLSKVDIGKVMEGINTVRSFLANAQKVASTLNQLGITASNVQKFLQQVDVGALMNLLGGGDSSISSSEDTTDSSEPNRPIKSPRRTNKKKMVHKNIRRQKLGTNRRYVNSGVRRRKSSKSVPLFKMPK